MLEIEPLIQINLDNCVKTYACIRNCPVKAIHLNKETMYPYVKPERCIGCGNCVTSCKTDAVLYRSSVADAIELLQNEKNLVAIISPSISVEFSDITDYRKFVTMVKALGFNNVYDSSFGIDLIAEKYSDIFSDFRGRHYISSCDPVVVSYIEKYHPNLVNNLMPFTSPMIAMTKIVRDIHGRDSKVIYIGPEIARKDELLRYDDESRINVALTFPELRKLFKEFNIDESNLEFSDFADPRGRKGVLYPIKNGMMQAANCSEDLLNARTIPIEGMEDMIQAVNEFEKSVKVIHRNLHIVSGNCLEGPGITKKGNKLYKEYLVIKYAQKQLQTVDVKDWIANINQYQELDLSASFTPNDQRYSDPPKDKIKEALQKLGSIKGREINCGRCGYNSCNEFAKDMAKGIVSAELCATYTARHSVKYSKTIESMTKKLDDLQKKLDKSEAMVQSEHDNAEQAYELTNAMLEKLRAGIVIVNKDLSILKANITFARILGEEALDIFDVIPGLVGADLSKLFAKDICQLFNFVLDSGETVDGRDIHHESKLLNLSIFAIHENQIAGAIVRDMQAPEVQRAEVIKRVNEVIDTNLGMVQKIGFLLGEGASDIERMLNSIIEFYQKEGPKNGGE